MTHEDLVTSDSVKALWKYFQKKYKTKLIKKSDSQLMKTTSKVLDRRGYMDKQSFMNDYYTTVCIGPRRVIYTPSCSSIGNGNFDALVQDIEDACHEFTHVRQKNGIKYLLNSGVMTRAETTAYLTNQEIQHYLIGQLYNDKALADMLIPYGATGKDTKYAVQKYKTARSMISRGYYKQKTVLQAIAFLEKYGK